VGNISSPAQKRKNNIRRYKKLIDLTYYIVK